MQSYVCSEICKTFKWIFPVTVVQQLILVRASQFARPAMFDQDSCFNAIVGVGVDVDVDKFEKVKWF